MGNDGEGNRSVAGREARCLVLMYHYVHDVEPLPLPQPGTRRAPPGIRGLSTTEFRQQLDWLTRTLEPVDWPRLYAWTQGRGSIPQRSFLLTFDDGLSDHARHVVPILNEYGLRGVFFVPGAVLMRHRMLGAHALHILLSILDEQTIEEGVREYVAEVAKLPSDSVTEVDQGAALRLYDYESPPRARLKYLLNIQLPSEVRNGAIESIFERYVGSMTRWARHWYLGWDDLVQMTGQGHTIGAHGFSHEPFARLTPGERADDLRKAKDALDSGLGPDLRPLSYPFGRFDDDCANACRDNGFVHAFTTEARWVRATDEGWKLPRYDTARIDAAMKEESVCPSTLSR